MKSWPKSKLGKVWVGLNIAQNQDTRRAPSKSCLVIIYPKSHEMSTKSEIRSNWTPFEHCPN